MHCIPVPFMVGTKAKTRRTLGVAGPGSRSMGEEATNYLMSSLRAPSCPSNPGGGGNNNRADTSSRSACRGNLEGVAERVNALSPCLRYSHSEKWAQWDTALVP